MATGRTLSTLCVYCGSSPGAAPEYAAAAVELGHLLASEQVHLVYGGGHVGLMGVIADAVIDAGGEAHGFITRALQDKEIAHRGLTSLTVVETMHERKAAMSDLADGFVMMPGGFGTLDEFMEAVTWTQLGIHHKPCGVLNVNGYFDALRVQLDVATRLRFISPENRDIVMIEREPGRLLDRMRSWTPLVKDKWLDRGQR